MTTVTYGINGIFCGICGTVCKVGEIHSCLYAHMIVQGPIEEVLKKKEEKTMKFKILGAMATFNSIIAQNYGGKINLTIMAALATMTTAIVEALFETGDE